MIIYILILLIALKLNIFNDWILGLWIAGIVLRGLYNLIEFIKFTVEHTDL